jgi:tetratricopeptide (TPR) repeat protein
MKKLFLLTACVLAGIATYGQRLALPASGGNIKCSASQRIGTTDIAISWSAPRVKGRDGKIYGTTIVHYGFQNLGFGSAKEAPWRAGANENTTFTFSSEVAIEGKLLAAGTYGFFIAVYPDSCTLIFSKNSTAWGSYFYDPAEDVLRVTVRQQKNLPESREWLAYEFANQTDNSTDIVLAWERWRIPFHIAIDVPKVTLDLLHKQFQNEPGFHADNWINAAQYCLDNNFNLDEALTWVENAPNFGAVGFQGLSLKSKILEKMGKHAEAEKAMSAVLDKAGVMELHQYGRQLINEKNYNKAMEVFQLNLKKNGDVWPTHVGLMRGYSAIGDIPHALEHARIALKQAPDDLNKKSLESAVKTLSEGKPLSQ